MIEVRPATSLGRTEKDGKRSAHHFCFAGYQDPDRMAWGRLRTINHVELDAGAGLKPEPLHDMEVITYVRHGALANKGEFRGATTSAGQVQIVSTGSGILHADENPGQEVADYLEIWIFADAFGEPPHRRLARLAEGVADGALPLLATGRPTDDRFAIRLRADATVFAAQLAAGDCATHRLAAGRKAYVLALDGRAQVNGAILNPGDGAAIVDEDTLELGALDPVELFLIDVRDDGDDA